MSLPPLSGGPVANDGSFFPQGQVRFGGRDGLFDDVVGHGWCIVTAEPSLLDRLTAPDRDAWAVIGGRTAALTPPQDGSGLDDTEGVYRAWFCSHRCKAAVVRPDWYVYGTADDAEELAGLLGQLARLLHGELPTA